MPVLRHLRRLFVCLFVCLKESFKEINTLQGCKKFIKSGSKDIYNVTISNKCCSFEISINQRILEKSFTVFAKEKKNVNSTTVFNATNSMGCFLCSKLANYHDFWRIMWHRRLEEWCCKFSFTITLIHLFKKYIQIENLLKSIIIFYNISFSVFLIK